MHAGKWNVCSKEDGTQRGRKNIELTHVVIWGYMYDKIHNMQID